MNSSRERERERERCCTCAACTQENTHRTQGKQEKKMGEEEGKKSLPCHFLSFSLSPSDVTNGKKGSLALYIKSESQILTEVKATWIREAAQADQWMQAEIPITYLRAEPFQLVFEAKVGTGHKGDIAIDDLHWKVGDSYCTSSRQLTSDGMSTIDDIDSSGNVTNDGTSEDDAQEAGDNNASWKTASAVDFTPPPLSASSAPDQVSKSTSQSNESTSSHTEMNYKNSTRKQQENDCTGSAFCSSHSGKK